MDTRTLRPGLLVSLNTSIRGNRSYTTHQIDEFDQDGEQHSRWETHRVIEDPKEYSAARLARRKARSRIARVCSDTAFGLLCPLDREKELAEGIAEANEVAAEFNRDAKITSVEVRVISGRVEQSDVTAVRAITSEVRQLMEDIESGINRLDVKAVRGACDKLRDVGQMLGDDAKERVQGAIKTARAAARQIVKAGEGVAVEIDSAVLDKINEARTSFLDFEDELASVAVPEEQGERALDIQGYEPSQIAEASETERALDFA